MNRGPWFSVPCARIPRILGRSRVSERLGDEGREAQRQTTPSGIAARFFVISARVAAFPAPDQEPIQRPIPDLRAGQWDSLDLTPEQGKLLWQKYTATQTGGTLAGPVHPTLKETP
jgi:hypothetical protein